ncbi:MAG: diacylglycerol kinase [Planctomycetaceae bacterium]|nr:diacylglycerol kinase [Planctomycetaceae bacterium]
MSERYEPPRGWVRKFRNAFRGVVAGERSHSSFLVHAIATAAVIGLGAWFDVSASEWCLLTLCIVAVLTAELFNSSIEALAKSVSEEYDANIRDALDIASAAVLLTAIGAVVVGCIIFLPRLFALAA